VTFESWIDRQVREARDRGEFDNLPGHGKPIADLDQPRDDLWWVKQLLAREQIGVTPPTLALRKARQELLERLPELRSEDQVRRSVEELNTRIRKVNRVATAGPPSNLVPLDVDAVVARWREVDSTGG
jgi:hypothetical protein